MIPIYTFFETVHIHLALYRVVATFTLLQESAQLAFVADQTDPVFKVVWLKCTLTVLVICPAPREHFLSLRFCHHHLLVDEAVYGERLAGDKVTIILRI